MKQEEVNRFNKLYERHLRLLKLQGKSEKTIDAYSRSVRRIRDHFDCSPDTLHRIQVNCSFTVLSVIMKIGARYPAGTGAVQNVRTMRPASGLTGSKTSYCLFTISWQRLHCLMN